MLGTGRSYRRRRVRAIVGFAFAHAILVSCAGGGNSATTRCLDEPSCPEAAQQAALAADLDTVQRYGATQNSYTSVMFDTEGDSVVLVAYFVDDLEHHRAVLGDLLEHPERLRVRASKRTRNDLARIREQVRQLLSNAEGWTLGADVDRVLVTLPPGQEQLAEQLRARFGDGIEVKIQPPPRPVVMVRS